MPPGSRVYVLRRHRTATASSISTETWIYKGIHTLTQAEIDVAARLRPSDLEALEASLPAQATMKVAYPATDGEAYFPAVTITGGAPRRVPMTAGASTSTTRSRKHQLHGQRLLELRGAPGRHHREAVQLRSGQLDPEPALRLQERCAGSLGNYTYGDVQRAIWALIDDNLSHTNGLGDYNQTRVNQIVAAAIANGEGYVPPCNGSWASSCSRSAAEVQIDCRQASSWSSSATASATSTTGDRRLDRVAARQGLRRHAAAEASVGEIVKITVDGAKSGDGLTILAGEPINWTYKVTNTGNVTLHNIVVRDSDFVADIGVIAELAPGASRRSRRPAPPSRAATSTGPRPIRPSARPPPTARATPASRPQITINKVTVDGATSGDGLNILTGEPIMWRYAVKSTPATWRSRTSRSRLGAGVTPAPVPWSATPSRQRR